MHWLRHDVLTLADPALATRREQFDLIVAELAAREPEDVRRICPVRVALQNQRDDLLAFAGVLDDKLTAIAHAHAVPEFLVRDACILHRLPSTSPVFWQGWNWLRVGTGGEFHAMFDAVSSAAVAGAGLLLFWLAMPQTRDMKQGVTQPITAQDRPATAD